jgi:hypothetical protein
LSNFDSVYGETYDESTLLSFVVNAELHMVEVEGQPQASDFFYGNEISFKFKLRDSVSKKTVVATERSNVFLSLKHQQQSGRSRTFTSTVQPATHFFDSNGKPQGFLIKWSINPNAVKGAGFLTISAQDADGSNILVYKDGAKEEVQFKVNIGGEIDVKWNFYTTKDTLLEETAFIVEFNLSCQERRLKDAQLRCTVVRQDLNDKSVSEEMFQLPVALSAEGLYEVSWTVPHKNARSGEYHFQFFREVDRLRSETTEKKGSDSEEPVKPLVEITAQFQAPSSGSLPFRTEFFVVLALGALFFGVNYKKSKY